MKKQKTNLPQIKVIQFFDLAFTDVCNQIRIFANITLTVNFLSCN